MERTSTLIYLVDDINFPSDIILTSNSETKEENFFEQLFFQVEYDPGEALVSKLLERI